MKTYRSLAFGLMGAAVLGLGAVTAGLAQPAQGPGGMPPEHGMRMDPAQHQARMQEHAQRQAARLRAVLQLRADQEPALQAFLTSMRPPEGMAGHGPGMGGHGMGGMGRPETLTTPQRLDRMSQRMAERQRRFQAHADAVRRFYGQLTPTQQAAFDALPPMMGHGGHRGMRGPHGMGGHGMGGPGMGGPGMGGMGMGGMGPGH